MLHTQTGAPQLKATVRCVAMTYPDCCRQDQQWEPIDVELAKKQHEAYVHALAALGVAVIVLPADARFPDGCFVEDTAVLLDDTAVLTCPGAPTRQGEQEAVAQCLARWMDVVAMPPSGHLEGGDVLRIGKTLYVGLSRRTNMAGLCFLEQVARPKGYRVVPVPIGSGLHLKTSVTYVGRSTVIAAPAICADVKEHMNGLAVLELPDDCAYAANVLNVGGTVMIPSGYPWVADRIAALGFRVKEMEMSEFRKGEAGLTCLSLMWEAPGSVA